MSVVANKTASSARKSAGQTVFPASPYPAWLSGSNFISLTVIGSLAVGIMIFFIANEDLFISLTFGVFGAALCFLLLFNYRRRKLKEYLDIFNNEQQLRRKLKKISVQNKPPTSNKLTIEDNAIVVNEIIRKSKAAQILKNLPEGHLEIVEMAQHYLKRNKSELDNISAASPRIASLKKTRREVEKIHQYHLLTWASLESGEYIKKANLEPDIDLKLNYAEKALKILDSAKVFCPQEKLLLDSETAIKIFMTESKINQFLIEAEQKEMQRELSAALTAYQQAADELEQSKRFFSDPIVEEKINCNIDRLRNIV